MWGQDDSKHKGPWLTKTKTAEQVRKRSLVTASPTRQNQQGTFCPAAAGGGSRRASKQALPATTNPSHRRQTSARRPRGNRCPRAPPTDEVRCSFLEALTPPQDINVICRKNGIFFWEFCVLVANNAQKDAPACSVRQTSDASRAGRFSEEQKEEVDEPVSPRRQERRVSISSLDHFAAGRPNSKKTREPPVAFWFWLIREGSVFLAQWLRVACDGAVAGNTPFPSHHQTRPTARYELLHPADGVRKVPIPLYRFPKGDDRFQLGDCPDARRRTKTQGGKGKGVWSVGLFPRRLALPRPGNGNMVT
ncbi:hypothetical protein BC826DRAFT_972948 [Russula brevipes]|nr:hypothetical protein BC826DRAFT_972948 [Russula brevipes]